MTDAFVMIAAVVMMGEAVVVAIRGRFTLDAVWRAQLLIGVSILMLRTTVQ